jgi:hypothetical protein
MQNIHPITSNEFVTDVAELQKPASTAGKAPASTAGKAPAKTDGAKAAKKTASKSKAAPPADGEKKKRRKARKETYSSYIYKGMWLCIGFRYTSKLASC